MPITPDDMPDMDDDNMSAQPRPVRPNGGRRPAARMANAGQDASQDIDVAMPISMTRWRKTNSRRMRPRRKVSARSCVKARSAR
jgi:hypothetical protein